MSDTTAAVTDAPAPADTAASQPAQNAGTGLLGTAPTSTAPASTAADITTPAGPSGDQVGIESPYYARLIEMNPELEAHKSTLAFFTDTKPEDFTNKVAKSYAEAVKFKGILVPGAEADPKHVENYRKVNGIPSEAKDYKFTDSMVEKFKALGVEDPAKQAKYAEAAHKANITPAQFEALAETQAELVKEMTSGSQNKTAAEQQAAVQKLQSEWGNDFAAKLGDAQKMFDVGVATGNLDPETLTFKNDPNFVRWLSAFGSRIPKESTIHAGASAVFQGDASKYQQIVKEMASNPKHPITDHTHPDHQVELAKFIALKKQANQA